MLSCSRTSQTNSCPNSRFRAVFAALGLAGLSLVGSHPALAQTAVLTKTGSDNTGLTYLHAFDITTGKDKPGSPIQVTASVPGTGDGSVTVNGVPTVFFDGDHGNGRFHANGRAGLLFSNGTVYAAFARNSDSNPYHGRLAKD